MGNRLTLGISEDREFDYPRIPSSAFQASGPYKAALVKLDALLASPSAEKWHRDHWQHCLTSGSTLPAADYEAARNRFREDIRWILIHEAESARIWSKGPADYKEALRRYQKAAHLDSTRIKGAIQELRRFDRKHAYLLRYSLERALQDFMSEEKIRRIRLPNMNHDKGYESRVVSGPAVRRAEFQFISGLSFFRFDEMLNAWDREIDFMFSEWPAHWREFGALRFAHPVSPVAAAKMNVVQLGLIARLTSRLRDFTSGYGVRICSTGQPIPSHGKPCWEVVAEFVNCGLSPSKPLTGDTARRIWQSISTKYEITTQAWPRPARSESQVQKI